MGAKTRSAVFRCMIRGDVLKNFLVADFEFTVYTKPTGRPRGFFSEVLEYGWVLLEGEELLTTVSGQDFVKPEFFPKQAKDSREFSMITEDDLKNAIKYPEMIERLNKVYLPNKTYFVAWGDADWRVIKEACNRYRVPNPLQEADYLDLSLEYKSFFELSYRPSLKDALNNCNIELSGFWHTALADAQNTALLLKHMYEKGWRVSVSEAGAR